MKNIFRQLGYGWLVFGILLVACSPGSKAGPEFTESWVRPVPPGMKMTAAFGVLSNPGRSDIEFVSFASPDFGDVSLHRTEVQDGVSRMLEVPALSIGAGAEVMLEPGGYHLMLMMPVGEIQPGRTVTIELATADGRRFSYQVPVERR
ncbi:MAG: copper chaperone PCu(A)C [Xanthomonadales bacterium]|nr:copper chaperone PCu(A)C [Gammaproteobacteria bacterium]MBT8054657.1 copper chaperone PCu(A)C [Gammaproteobacteria bacterium]NND55747.1 copper chaperone PCu(A)C [Xanthomonadales bacterium]NNK50158.1 copper chaperone PCu(A)C [Xanthomonadales bacterium]